MFTRPAALAGLLVFSSFRIAVGQVSPATPVFGSNVYNVTVSNPAIDGGGVASTSSSDNSVVLQDFVNYCSAHGGGTVEIPAGTYVSNTIGLDSNVNLQIDSGAVLKDASYNETLITTSASSSSNMEISGGGIIDGSATTAAGGAKLVNLSGVNTLEVTGVSIEDAGNEHLVTEKDSNVTINNVTIADPETLAANNGNYLNNTDGIDYWGSNILIENCNINDGDDDIVAKPASGFCSNVEINNCTIGAGHGISIGGGSAHGLNGLIVQNCTLNGSVYGIRIKAEDASGSDAGGGAANPVQNVFVNNITMNDVDFPIDIDSFYNGDDNFPDSPTDPTYYPASPVAADSRTPFVENFYLSNITAYNAYYAGIIAGLNTSPANVNGLYFYGDFIEAYEQMELWYAANVDLSGLTVEVPPYNPYYNGTALSGIWEYDVTGIPEPMSGSLMITLGTVSLVRRKRSSAEPKAVTHP